MRRFIYVTEQFEAFHRWKDAPDEVAFLRSMHRHMFHVKVTIEVKHDDRDIEFIMFKRKVRDFLREKYEMKEGIGSCEMIAESIIEYLKKEYPGRDVVVEVSEDGENGAIVQYQDFGRGRR